MKAQITVRHSYYLSLKTLQELKDKPEEEIDLDNHIDEQIYTAYTIGKDGSQRFRSQTIQQLVNGKRDPRYLPEGNY